MIMRAMRRLGVGLWLAVCFFGGLYAWLQWSGRPDAPTIRPDPATAAAVPATPARLPAITLPDAAGTPRALTEWAGRTLLVNFWATWCAPCREEMPLLDNLQQRSDPAVLQVVGIAFDSPDAVLRFMGETGIGYPSLISEGSFAAGEAFGEAWAGVLPFTVVAAPDGTLLWTHSGVLTAMDLARVGEVAAGLAVGRTDNTAATTLLAARDADKGATP